MSVIVVGLDGADWSLLEGWCSERHLPNLERVRSDGVHGGLESTLPPITFPAWKCYSTGKTPGKLGVYEWFSYLRDTNELVPNDATDYRSREYWDVLANAGLTAAVVNMPTTHPPRASEGVSVVAGSPASERKEFTAPAELKTELLTEIPDYRVKPDLVLDEATPEELVSEAETLVDQRFDAATWFADERECDLVHLTVFITDTVQHRLWDRPARIRQVYERIDDRLGDLLDAGHSVVVMSDHGFVEIDEVFLPNQWLLERGDMVTRSDTSRSVLGKVGLTRERLKRWVARAGLVRFAQAVVPESLQRLFPHESGRVSIYDVTIDWEETKAFGLGRGPVYLNDDAFESASARREYRDQLVEALLDLETPDGQDVVADVHDPEDIYTGEIPNGPDLVVEYEVGIDAPEAIGGELFGEQTKWLATHRRTGVFAAIGDEFDAGVVDLSIYDLAPTLLHAMGCPVPSDVDGELRTEVLSAGTRERDVEEGPPTAIGSRAGDRDEAVEETLRELGYLE